MIGIVGFRLPASGAPRPRGGRNHHYPIGHGGSFGPMPLATTLGVPPNIGLESSPIEIMALNCSAGVRQTAEDAAICLELGRPAPRHGGLRPWVAVRACTAPHRTLQHSASSCAGR